jgi:hypothetical protein
MIESPSEEAKTNTPQLVYRRQSAGCLQGYGDRDEMAPDIDEYWPNQLRERMDVPKIV